MRCARVYAIKFSNGIVKIGSTSQIRQRFQIFSRLGYGDFEEVLLTPKIDDMAFCVESEIVRRVSNVFLRKEGREYFYCSQFGAVENIVRQVFRQSSGEDVGWRRYSGCNPIPRLPAGWQQKALKMGRWMSLVNNKLRAIF